MREKDGLPQTHWKNSQIEYFNYFCQYVFYFNSNEPDFSKALTNDILPLYLKIFGEHTDYDPNKFNIVTTVRKALLLLTGRYDLWLQLIKNDSIIKDEQLLTEKSYEFANLFLSCLNQYRLFHKSYSDDVNIRLAYTVYSSIEFGFTELRPPIQPVILNAGLSEELLDELWNGYSVDEWIASTEANFFRFPNLTEEELNDYKNNPFRPPFLPPAKSFQFLNFQPSDSLEEYENAAVDAYREHVKAYLNNIEKKLKKHGWTRNKLEKYERAEWLVIWNKHDLRYLWEILQYIPGFTNVDVNDDIQRHRTVFKLRKAFKRFEELGLPIRKSEEVEKL